MPTARPPDPGPAREGRGADDLAVHVAAADAALASTPPPGAILHVARVGDHGRGELGCFPLAGMHPLGLLVGFVAPDHWEALGVSCQGRSHPLDDGGRVSRQGAATACTITVLLDREGRAAGLLRQDGIASPLPGPPDGAVADACRRALGLPTAPPPRTTEALWTACWLDRLVAAACTPGGPSVRTWAQVASLHPAASLPAVSRRGAARAPHPPVLAAATVELAEAWPWSRLRAEPDVVEVPCPLPGAAVAGWMDDGMWARWLLSAFPSFADLVAAVRDLLPGDLAAAVAEVVDALTVRAELP